MEGSMTHAAVKTILAVCLCSVIGMAQTVTLNCHKSDYKDACWNRITNGGTYRAIVPTKNANGNIGFNSFPGGSGTYKINT
jgi:hypothetical protein